MPLTLSSKRLLLRDFLLDDWPVVHAYAARPEVYRFQPWGPSTSTEARKFIELAMVEAQKLPRANYTLAIVLAATAQVIGSCSLVIHSEQFRHGEIGYFVHPDYWNRGYATEVTQLLLHFGFITCDLHRIIGTCDPRNTASVRVLEKVGMQREGRLRETMLIRDGWRDSLLYSLLKHEWQARQEKHMSTYATDFLEQVVHIVVDRPLGSRHPQGNVIYPLNYGYVPHTRAPDGEEVDAHVLSVFEPVSQFAGRCIAVIHRTNDADDKLVIVPEGTRYGDDQIRALTEFQERFFTSVIIRA